MTTLREAAQQVFEAWSRPNGINYVDFRPYMEALRTALAKPVQCRTDGRCQYAIDSGAEGIGHCPNGKCVMPRTEPEQEPVAWIHEDELPSSYPYDLMFPYSKVNGVRLFPVFGPSPQRKPLTDEEILRISLDTPVDLYAFARAIERAHGIGEQT